METRKGTAQRKLKKKKMRQCFPGKHWENTAALQVAVEESVDYCLLGESPVTMGKFVRWLQSSQEPSYIFAL